MRLWRQPGPVKPGPDFAVVADEVRNLAMRAAEAARSTADLIEATVRKVEEGARDRGPDLRGLRPGGVQFRQSRRTGQRNRLGLGRAGPGDRPTQFSRDGNGQSGAAKTPPPAEEAAAASESICHQADQMREQVAILADMVLDPRKKNRRRISCHADPARRQWGPPGFPIPTHCTG